MEIRSAKRSAMSSQLAPGRLFVFGLGYSALALARGLMARGWRIAGTCRGEEKRTSLASEGIEAFRFDRGRPLDDGLRALAGATHILSSVPPDRTGDPVLDHHAADLAGCREARWVGYLSTTGVYGDRGGDWVDESSELRPVGSRGQRRVAAEAAWRALWREHGCRVHVFRLAGIYGPGRNALEQVRRGEARRIVRPGQVFSRIHVEDIARVLIASMTRPDPGAIYNVCDDAPTPPQDVVTFACELLGVAPPPEIPYAAAAPHLSEMARSFYAESKRVANRKIKTELGVRLAYPDYRSGVRALFEAWRSSASPG